MKEAAIKQINDRLEKLLKKCKSNADIANIAAGIRRKIDELEQKCG